MKCPVCRKGMASGKLLFKVPWQGGIRLHNGEELSVKDAIMRVLKDKNAIAFSGEGEGWYCEACNKVVAVLDADKK